MSANLGSNWNAALVHPQRRSKLPVGLKTALSMPGAEGGSGSCKTPCAMSVCSGYKTGLVIERTEDQLSVLA
jgi:hypothetical protein